MREKKIHIICDPFLFWTYRFSAYIVMWGEAIYMYSEWRRQILRNAYPITDVMNYYCLLGMSIMCVLCGIWAAVYGCSPRISARAILSKDGIDFKTSFHKPIHHPYDYYSYIEWALYDHRATLVPYIVLSSRRHLRDYEKYQINCVGTNEDMIVIKYNRRNAKALRQFAPASILHILDVVEDLYRTQGGSALLWAIRAIRDAKKEKKLREQRRLQKKAKRAALRKALVENAALENASASSASAVPGAAVPPVRASTAPSAKKKKGNRKQRRAQKFGR